MASNPRQKRPYSPHESPQRNTRLRNAIHRDVLFEQGIPPLFATFSSRGSRAISCFRNGFARVWNVDPVHDRFLDCQHVLRHTETVFRAAIADDGTRAVTTAGDGVARVWELQSPHPRCKELACQFRSTRTCDISCDGQFVAATFYTGKRAPLSMYRGMIILYEPARDFYHFRISVYGVPDKVKVSRDATTIAVGCYGVNPAKNFAKDNRITIFNREGTEIISFEKCFPNHDSCVSWDLSDDGQVLAICANNRQCLHIYSNRDQRTWKDPPQTLLANAELTYETCRIVDNGDLVSTIAHDQDTDERSILVFSPATGQVLFSLACGLLEQRACLDIEPRVCYVAPSHNCPGRKVVRLLTRTGGNNTGVLELVRCGDPPKNASHGPSPSFNSAPSFSSRENVAASNPKVPQLPDPSQTIARLVPDCPGPMPPKPMDWSPRGVSAQPAGSKSVPHDDTFKLRKAITKENTSQLSPLQSLPLNSSSPTLTTVTEKNRILRTEKPKISAHEVQKLSKSVANCSKQGSSSPCSNMPTKSTSKDMQVSPKAQQPSDTVLSPKSALVKRNGPARSMDEKRSGKSTILSNSASHAAPSPKQTVTPYDTNLPSAKHTGPSIVQKAPTNSDAQATSKKELTTTEQINKTKNDETKDCILQTEMTKRTHDTSIETKPKTTIVVIPEKTRKVTDLEKIEPPTSNLKKPRWQPARLRARKYILENPTLESKIEESTSGSKGRGRKIVEGIDRSHPVGEKLHHEPNLDDRTEERTDLLGSSEPVENPGNAVDDARKDSEAKIPCDQLSQGISASPSVEVSKSPCPQQTMSFSSPRIQGSGAQPEVSEGSRDANNGERKIKTPKITTGDQIPSCFVRLVRIPEGQPDITVGGEVRSVHSLQGLKREEEVHKTPQEVGAKQETVLDQNCIQISPHAVILSNSTALAKDGSSTLVKSDPGEEQGNHRYLDALERAKTMFRRGSHKVEGGVPVLSNVKAFKTMLAVIANEGEVVDRKGVAKIVYEKGGINNTLNENLFLQAFVQLYEELQGLRQQQWIEVYNHAAAGEGEGLLVFHARDLIKRESSALKTGLNPIWNDNALDELIASQTADGVLVSQDAFVQSTEKIFSI